MVGFPNNFPSDAGITACVVTGGHQADRPPDESANMKIIDPIRHGPNINPKDMPFLSMIKPPTQSSLEHFDPPAEPGTVVYAMSTTGEPSGRVVLGQPNEQNNNQASPGNFSLWGIHGDRAQSSLTGKNVPPDFEEKEERGAKRRAIKEKGREWAHELTKGLPTHAALFPMAGNKLPAVKSVETAIQQFSNIMNSNILSNLPGSAMSLSSLFSKMSSSDKKKIKEKMPKEVADGFESMLFLIQSGDGDGSYVSDFRVKEDTFIKNSVDLLSQATTLSDLMEAMARIEADPDIRGLDELPENEIEIDTAFGKIKQKIDGKGNVSNQVPEQVQQAIQKFVGMLSNAASAPTAERGENLFNKSAPTMANMLGRLAPDVQKFRNKLLEDLNTSAIAQKLDEVRKIAVQGGDILSAIKKG